jgi:hypothetical protein
MLTLLTDLIYKCGGIDKRTIEKFEKVRTSFPSLPHRHKRKFLLHHPSVGGGAIFWWGSEIFGA